MHISVCEMCADINYKESMLKFKFLCYIFVALINAS